MNASSVRPVRVSAHRIAADAAPQLDLVRPQFAQAVSSFEPAKKQRRAIPGDSTVAVIGDSHTAGQFGNALRGRLSNYLDNHGGKLKYFKGVGGSATSHWLNGGVAGPDSEQVPKLKDVLKAKPDVLVVALGTNQLRGSKQSNESQIRQVLKLADEAGTKVVWVGPPNVRGFHNQFKGNSIEERRFYDALRTVNASRREHGKTPISIVNSRLETNENRSVDGLHFKGPAAKRWANGVFDQMTRPREG